MLNRNFEDDLQWAEKYRPTTIQECVLPDYLKKQLQSFVDKGYFPNLLLSGPSGTGKTTSDRALCDQLGYDYILINASRDRNMDMVRTTIQNFASSVSLTGSKKCIILDEADGLNPESAQPALRGAMEEFKSVTFILTCNYKNKIKDALHSRTTNIEFKITKDQKSKLAQEFYKVIRTILKTEGVTFDKTVVANVLWKHYPDSRRVLNELQKLSSTGEINEESLASSKNGNIDDLIASMRKKNFSESRKWVAENSDMDIASVFRKFYDEAYNLVDEQSIPVLVLLIAEYQYKNAFVADVEINLMAFLTEVMSNVNFK